MQHEVVLIPGDGIGPEVAEAAKRVLDAAGADILWTERQAGLAAIAADPEHATPEQLLPKETTDAILRCKVALKSPCTTPVGKGFRSVNVALRKQLDLYAAVRPVRSLPGVKTRYENVDILVVRENTEGLYAGIENEICDGVVTSLKVATDKASRRVARFAFELARARGRKKVTVLHKANIMKLSDGLFLRCAREEHARYDEIQLEEHIIDAASMRLVQDPTQYDVLLCENLYGDIISDLCAGLIGGLGVSPGANFGEKGAVFEAVHGSAPDIAGQDKANPVALLTSAAMMLEHLADTSGDTALLGVADRLRAAIYATLAAGEKTGDLGGRLGTRAFTDALIARL